MSASSEHLKWAMRRRREDDSRRRTSVPRKLRAKLTNLTRRLTIFLSRPYFKQFSRWPLPDLARVRSVLIIPHDPIGDLLLTEPMWRKLRTEWPDLRIGLAISSRNAALAEIFSDIDDRYNIYGGSLSDRWKALKRAREAGYDVLLVPVGFYKPARFAFVSRFIAGRRGFTATMHHSRPKRYADFYSYCTERAWRPYPQPMAEQYQALVEHVFHVHYNDDERTPRLPLSQELLQASRERVEKLRAESGAKRVILAHLEAKVEPREWGIANLERLQAELPDSLFLVTASPQYWSANPLDVKHSSSIQRVDTKSILEAAALVAAVDLLLSPDTSIVHFAGALGTPIVAFYPFEDEWLPYRAKSVVLFPKRREPISTIGVAEVRDAIKSLLRD